MCGDGTAAGNRRATERRGKLAQARFVKHQHVTGFCSAHLPGRGPIAARRTFPALRSCSPPLWVDPKPPASATPRTAAEMLTNGPSSAWKRGNSPGPGPRAATGVCAMIGTSPRIAATGLPAPGKCRPLADVEGFRLSPSHTLGRRVWWSTLPTLSTRISCARLSRTGGAPIFLRPHAASSPWPSENGGCSRSPSPTDCSLEPSRAPLRTAASPTRHVAGCKRCFQAGKAKASSASAAERDLGSAPLGGRSLRLGEPPATGDTHTRRPSR